MVAIHSNQIERVHVLVQTGGAERHLLSRGNPPHVPTTAPMPGPRAAARTGIVLAQPAAQVSRRANVENRAVRRVAG